jgi:quercetin dioxygenase-like cupin family protein
MIRALLAGGVLAGLAGGALAQDPAKVAPDIYKLKLSEKGVRVFEVSFKPNQKIATHSHPDHVVYALTDGKIMITEEGKEGQTTELKAGETMYLPAQTHHAQNMTDKPLKVLVVELPTGR